MAAITELDPSSARQLTDRIKVAVEGTWLLIQEAYLSRAWAALNYATWDEYLDTEFRGARLALPREERAETVQSMREAGMSLRAISAATGLSHETVRRDAAVTNVTPESVQGVDGKSYAPTRQPSVSDPSEFAGGSWLEPDQGAIDSETVAQTVTIRTPEPAKTKRRPLTEAFAESTREVARAAERLDRLREDDRFTRNRDQTHHQMPDLIAALEHTTRLVQAMNLPAAEVSEEARRWWATSLNKISDALTGVANSLEQEQ
jgi:hypothetical protein